LYISPFFASRSRVGVRTGPPNFKVHFYQQETMVSPPVKLAIPFLFNLYTNPREDTDKQITDGWVIGPVLKMVSEFEASVKKHPLIAMGTPDPYTPPN
jgi:hypothetical protein